MNILLIGDPSGNDDEGMKKIGRELAASLGANTNTNARFTSVKDVFLNPKAFGTPEIIHYVGGPSWRSIVYAHLLKMRVGSKGTKTIISFIHPHWSRLASLAFRFFKPDAAVVQSVRWKTYCSHFDLKIWDQPIVGVNLNRFRPVSLVEKQRIRDELAFPKNKKIVLHVGHLNRGRNLLFFKNLIKKDVLPVVIGSTTVQPDDELVKRLEAAGVLVIHKYLEGIEKFYQAADCYVFPTIDPSFCVQIPLSIVEAMACGLSVVSTRFEGLPLFFPEGYPGITYADDLDVLQAKVHDALSSSASPEPEKLACFEWAIIAKGLREFYASILRDEKNRAPMIALFGPDGSGKSTVAKLIEKHCEEIGIRSVRRHWRPGFLPYRKFSYQKDEKRFTNPHMNKARGSIKSLLIFLYIAIDFIIGYYFFVRPHLHNGVLVIYERYYYDIIIDQKRYGLRVPIFIRTFFAKFIHVPDTLILLDASGDILFLRKGELDRTEIERQRLMMKKYLSRFDGFSIVDVENILPVEVVNIILRIVEQQRRKFS